MHIEAFREYCIQKKGVSEELPFDAHTLVFKVMGKIFALTSLEGEFSINLKCNPEKAQSLRESYPAVQPGYHMNKKHWNTIVIDGSIKDPLLCTWIDESYELVCVGLPKKLQKKLDLL